MRVDHLRLLSMLSFVLLSIAKGLLRWVDRLNAYCRKELDERLAK